MGRLQNDATRTGLDLSSEILAHAADVVKEAGTLEPKLIFR
jgi:hypothetical protein